MTCSLPPARLGALGDRSAACCAPCGLQDECTHPACAACKAHTPASATCIAIGAPAAAAPSGPWSIWSLQQAGCTCLHLPRAPAAVKVVLMAGAATASSLAACDRALAAQTATSVASPKRASSCVPRDVPRARSHAVRGSRCALVCGPLSALLCLMAAVSHPPPPLLPPLPACGQPELPTQSDGALSRASGAVHYSADSPSCTRSRRPSGSQAWLALAHASFAALPMPPS